MTNNMNSLEIIFKYPDQGYSLELWDNDGRWAELLIKEDSENGGEIVSLNLMEAMYVRDWLDKWMNRYR